jgi:tetratricopeptide (TPR) repeat protein
MAEPTHAEPRYRAFLSYSHKDADEAARIHRRLESYRMPRRLVGRVTDRGLVPRRLWPIFRDRDELAASADLGETVRTALAESAAVIVLCSPAAAASLWVAEEIATFSAVHPDRPVLAAIIGGEPPGCVPAQLRVRSPDGAWHEPLATDMRRERDGLRLGLLKLVAGLTGVGLDDLVQRDAHRRIRRVTAVTGLAVAATLIMAASTVVALGARREADRQRAQAEGLVEFMLTDLRQGLKAVGRLDIMDNVNRRAMAYYEGQGPLENLLDDSLERRARVIGAIGEDDENSDNYDLARERYLVLYQTTGALLHKDPDNPARILAHARSENRLGLLAITMANRPDADRMLHLAEASRRLRESRRLLASIADWGRDRADWLRLAAYTEGNSCATMLRRGEDRRAALDHCRRAVAHNERLVALNGNDLTASYDLVSHLSWLAEAQHAVGQTDTARLTQARYLELMNSLVAHDPDNMLWREQQMQLYVRHARFLRAQGDPQGASRLLTQARAISRRLVARDPRNAVWSDYWKQLSEPEERSQ